MNDERTPALVFCSYPNRTGPTIRAVGPCSYGTISFISQLETYNEERGTLYIALRRIPLILRSTGSFSSSQAVKRTTVH